VDTDADLVVLVGVEAASTAQPSPDGRVSRAHIELTAASTCLIVEWDRVPKAPRTGRLPAPSPGTNQPVRPVYLTVAGTTDDAQETALEDKVVSAVVIDGAEDHGAPAHDLEAAAMDHRIDEGTPTLAGV